MKSALLSERENTETPGSFAAKAALRRQAGPFGGVADALRDWPSHYEIPFWLAGYAQGRIWDFVRLVPELR